MTEMHRSLSSTAMEHLLSCLEKAGFVDSDANKVTGSVKNALAEKLVTFIRAAESGNTTGPRVSQEFGIKRVSVLSHEEIAALRDKTVGKVVALGQEESLKLHHNHVGTEHLLLGIIRGGRSVATETLANILGQSIGLERLDEKIRKRLALGFNRKTDARDIATNGKFTHSARKVLWLAQEESQGLRHRDVDAEHVLLGLIRDRTGIAGTALRESGVILSDARKEIKRIHESN